MVLVAYTSVILTIIGAIIGFMLYHFVPMKTEVKTIWHDLYNGSGAGSIESADKERKSMRDMLEDMQDQQRDEKMKTEHIMLYLRDLSHYLEERNESAPHIFDDNYVKDWEFSDDDNHGYD